MYSGTMGSGGPRWYREMSQILGLGESNVGTKINRIKAALASQLAKEELNGL